MRVFIDVKLSLNYNILLFNATDKMPVYVYATFIDTITMVKAEQGILKQSLPEISFFTKFQVPYRMKIYAEFNLATLLRLVKFTE